MSTLDIHPEDLFDKAEAGSLSEGETARLEHHLAHCAVCRFEWEARGDFDREATVMLASQRKIGLLQSPAMPELPLPSSDVPVTPPTWNRAASKRRRRLGAWGLAAATFVLAAGAFAAFAGGRFLSPTESDQSAARARATQTHAARATMPVEHVASAAPRATDSATQAAPSLEPVPASRIAVVHAPVAANARRTRVQAPPAPAPAAETTESARTLFAAANRARREGDPARATQLYRGLQQKFPGSPEAELSQITLSTLLLGTNPSQALQGFEAYLARGARPLEAEALVGRARALARLGRRSAELATWSEVLRRYPNSIYGKQAKERLEAQGVP